jgi:hypothetical protein
MAIFCKGHMNTPQVVLYNVSQRLVLGTRRLPRGSTFAAGILNNPLVARRTLLVYGTDDGIVHLFDLWTGCEIGSLEHPCKLWLPLPIRRIT